MYLTEAQKQAKVDAYIARKKAEGLPWDTLEFDYLLKDLNAPIWNGDGMEMSEGD
ncbi:hypothetical protein [Burkholderia pseudomallei]|uniref:hypothetical protein n=1 Tax=Burkholderia pseudomallei TaxID=28450 RepID=UPI000B211C60|nr:hypothetical protein [Burkholderia pseudomallei]